MGGGFGIYYREGDTPAPVSEFAEMMFSTLSEEFRFLDFPMPTRLTVEPGRSIVGAAGTTLYTIGSIKTIPCVRTYVAVDGGMGDNPRPALYQAKYEMAIANKMNVPNQIVASVTGKYCESGDMLIWDASMPWVEAGDLLAVSCTGAYNYSMASNYNSLCRPAVILVNEGESDLIVKRETLEDLVRNDVIPDRLK
jgi:diaminopimelate decarboxylase